MNHPFGHEMAKKTLSWQDGPLLTDDTPIPLGSHGARDKESMVVNFAQVKNREAGDAVTVIILSYNTETDEYNPIHEFEYVEGAGSWGECWVCGAPGEQLYAALDSEYVAGTEVHLNVQGIYFLAA